MYYMHSEYMHFAYNRFACSMCFGGLLELMMQKEPMCCPDKPHHMERFLEVCLLLLLNQETGHGYGLMERLQDFGFSAEVLNIGTLYRTLRNMEKSLSVTSHWVDTGHGPRRRMYKITDAGREELSRWVTVLRERKSRIELVITKFEEQLQG
jgi:PadR family transcriptional regulator, regulatory protein PadR